MTRAHAPVGTKQAGRDASRQRAEPAGAARSAEPREHELWGLQRVAGNHAVVQLLKAQAHRSRLNLVEAHDADEKSADEAAAQMMHAPERQLEGGARCGCGAALALPGSCGKCRSAARVLQRRATGCAPSVTGAPAIVHQVLDGPGQALDQPSRAFFEPRLGADLTHVRVHTDSHAAKSADAVGAFAYTVGHQLVFGDGQYAPGTQRGRELIAHELAHVLQQGAAGRRSLRRRPRPDLLNVNLSPAEARAMSDGDLDQSMVLLRDQLASMSSDSRDYRGAQENLMVLEAESDRRKQPAPVASPGPVPAAEAATRSAVRASQPQGVQRPAGLPLDQSFQLVPADDALPASVKLALAEGEVTTLPGTALGAVSVGSAMNVASNSMLSVTGFASAGENSIGLVGMSSYNPLRALKGVGPLVPESISTLGHTAAYVRIGNRIVSVRGFTPKLLKLLAKYGSTVSGDTGVAGTVANDAWLFSKFSSQSVEWSVRPELAEKFLQEMDQVGELSRVKWSGVPAGCQGTNCVMYAVEQVEGKLGGRVAVPTSEGPLPITDMGSRGTSAPRTAAQGKFIEVLKGVERGTQELAPMEGALGPGVAGSLRTAPRYIQVLKYGGRVFFVVGAAASVAEVAMAKEGERTRTAVGAGAGFVGGLALGATAGLFCGPGAPVCSVVLGLGFGIVGGLASRTAAEGIYDVATGRVEPSTHSYPMNMYPGTCFTGDTMIRLADRGLKRIDTILPGDRVLGFDDSSAEGDAACLRACEVTATFKHSPQAYCEVELNDGGLLKVTANHLLFVNGTWLPAGQLRPGDALCGADEEHGLVSRHVLSIERRAAQGEVHDISISDCHTYFADGVLAHNKGP